MVNSKLTATLAGVVAGASGVAAIFEPVVTGTAVSLPLLTGTAGSFTLPLAVLGVLKLAAAASLAGVGVGSAFLGPVKDLVPEVPGLPISSSSAYGSYYHRQRRSIDVGSDEAVFGLVSSLDMYSCGKALVCSLASKPALEEDEALIMSLFADGVSRQALGGPKAEYNLAAEYGALARDQAACQIRYQECPYTADQMMATLRSSNL